METNGRPDGDEWLTRYLHDCEIIRTSFFCGLKTLKCIFLIKIREFSCICQIFLYLCALKRTKVMEIRNQEER